MTRLPSLSLLAAGVLVTVGGTVGAQSQAGRTYATRLSPVPIDTQMQAAIAGTGSVTAVLAGARLTVSGTFDGLRSAATVARIHRGAKGVRGPAVFDLKVSNAAPAGSPPSGGSFSGTIGGPLDLTPTQLDDLGRERFYVQIHSETAPEGNLWGWLQLQENKR